MRKNAKKALDAVEEFFFPMATYCICCGNLIDRSRSYCLCDHCIRRIEWGNLWIDLAAQAAESGRKNYLDSASACISYGLYGRRLIFDLKYSRQTYTARILADIIADRILSDPQARFLTDTDYIVPVPLHKKRFAQRGFNQTAKIGKYLQIRLQNADFEESEILHETEAKPERRNFPKLLDHVLLRKKETAPQRALSAEERYQNLADAFSVCVENEKKLEGARILLLDDAYTTGATANQCAKALKEAGAAEVHLAVLATGNHFASGHFRQTSFRQTALCIDCFREN